VDEGEDEGRSEHGAGGLHAPQQGSQEQPPVEQLLDQRRQHVDAERAARALRGRFAPGERVAEIVEGRVTLDAELAELAESPADEEPGGAEITRDRDAEL
jgi:hypothetical protein